MLDEQTNPLPDARPQADHAFARIGGIPYRKAEAQEALAHTLEFFGGHLGQATK